MVRTNWVIYRFVRPPHVLRTLIPRKSVLAEAPVGVPVFVSSCTP